MLTTFTDAWSSTSSLGGNFGDVIGSERIEHFKLQDEMSRWLFNFHYHFYDDDYNGEMSMKMIVRMKEIFQLKCKKESHCLLRLESLLFNKESSSSPLPASPSIQGTRYLSNSVAMMKVITHDDVGNDDANDDVKIMMLTMMMNTNGNY